jgi:hypothetical protein
MLASNPNLFAQDVKTGERLAAVGSIRPTRVIGEGTFTQSLTSIFNGMIAFERCTCSPMECQVETKSAAGFTNSTRFPSTH